MYTRESVAFMQIHLIDSFIFGICMHIVSFGYTIHILRSLFVLLKKWFFMFFVKIWYMITFELQCLFSWKCYLHDSCTLTFYSFCHDLVSWTPFYELYRSWVSYLCIWYDSWNTYALISCFEGSLTSFSKIILTSYCSSFGSDFQC